MPVQLYSSTEVQAILVASLAKLASEDRELLRLNAHERAITHRLAVHLEGKFEGWAVDCEYNRQGQKPNPKMVPPTFASSIRALRDRLRVEVARNPAALERRALTVFPDIVVHVRGSQQNLLVVEVKKSNDTNPVFRRIDMLKLQAYATSPQLAYENAAFVSIPVGSEAGCAPRIEWIRGGTSGDVSIQAGG